MYVYLDTGVDEGAHPERDALIYEMHARIEDLRTQLEAERRANEENRRIIAALTQRIPPALEAPPEPRDAPQTPHQRASGGPEEGVEPRPDTGGAQEATGRRRSWLRRLLRG